MIPFFPAIWMFFISNWALVRSVMDGWVWKTPGTHPAVPLVSIILITLTVLMAIETLASTFWKERQPARLEALEKDLGPVA